MTDSGIIPTPEERRSPLVRSLLALAEAWEAEAGTCLPTLTGNATAMTSRLRAAELREAIAKGAQT